MARPARGSAIGSKHELSAFGTRGYFYWTGKGWSSDSKMRYYTKAAAMGVLGWRYVKPCEEKKEPESD